MNTVSHLPAMHKHVEIDGYRYLIQHPDPDTAYKIGIQLMKIVGDPLGTMAGSGSKENALAVLPTAIKSFLNNIDPDVSLALIKKSLASVELQGEVGGENRKALIDANTFKVHFAGRTGSMMRLAGETLAFQQEDFFLAIKDGIARMMTKV